MSDDLTDMGFGGKPIGCILDNVHGRLGNQLLRAAATVGLARRYGTEPRFESSWVYRDFFSIPDDWYVTAAEIDGMVQAHQLPDLNHIPEGYRHYLQDVSLWWDHRAEVRAVLQPSALALDAVNTAALTLGAMPGPVLAIHVRRGDNVTNEPGSINALPEDYYRASLPIARQLQDFKFVLIVTDDAAWCERHLAPFCRSFSSNVSVLHGVTRAKEHEPEYATEAPLDWVDLFVLTGCSDLIPRPQQIVISNSTFAYCAAIIGGYPNPIRPSYWVGEQLTVDQSVDVSLLFPAEWDRVIEVADPNPGRSAT